MRSRLILGIYFVVCRFTSGQDIDGCPMYGCRPGGTFSFDMTVPKSNASIEWVNDFFLGPVPDLLGCVGNSLSLVCQSNGAGPHDTGYVGVNLDTGSVRWRDVILRFPSLPVMDIDGDVWGSDGNNIISYDADGRPLMSNIPLDPTLRPLFSLKVTDSGLLIFISETGEISTRLTDGTPHASTYLKGTVERANGTFIPTAPPVVNGNRFYVLTEFVPDSDTVLTGNLGLQRLYAIDTFETLDERIKIAWYANFEKEANVDEHRLRFKPRNLKKKLIRKIKADSDMAPELLFDATEQTVYVSLPPPYLSHLKAPDASSYFLALMDSGNDSSLVFRTQRPVTNIVLYEMGSKHSNTPPSNAGQQLWVSQIDQKLCALKKDGSLSKALDISKLIKANFTITSKISVTRSRITDEDFLIFGIHVPNPSREFIAIASRFGQLLASSTNKNYVIGIDTPENKNSGGMPLAWLIPTPEDTMVQGQIIGMPATDSNGKNRLIAFSQTEEKFGKIFSIV